MQFRRYALGQTNTQTDRHGHNRHSLQFTMNKIVYKIFGAMSKDLYTEISAHFGIESVEYYQQIWRNRQLFMSNVALTVSFVSLYFIFYLLRLLNFCLLLFHLCCATTYDGEIKLFIILLFITAGGGGKIISRMTSTVAGWSQRPSHEREELCTINRSHDLSSPISCSAAPVRKCELIVYARLIYYSSVGLRYK